jgi:hypothetical protein
MTPEAIALHYIDNLDAKIHEFVRDIADDPNPQGSFTPFNARLDRKLYKGQKRDRGSGIRDQGGERDQGPGVRVQGGGPSS